MNRFILFPLILICLITLSGNLVIAAKVNPDLEIIRKRIISELMQHAVNENAVKNLMASVRPDGTWPGINYSDVSNTGFEHSRHLSNMVELSLAYKKSGSKFKNDQNLKAVIFSSLDYWLKNDFICQNWWWNQIGTPDQLIRVLLIMDTDLTKEQMDKALSIVGRANLTASGARPSGDRIKIAGILAKNALFCRDVNLFDETLKVIIGEIKFSTGRGMQYDYSFHHRTDRVTSTLSYGKDYADAFAEWAELVSGTSYSFPEKPMDQLIDYYLNGICQTMVYGKYPDPGAENRSITREGNLNPVGPITPERLLKASSYRKDELEKIVQIRKGVESPHLSFDRFYWDSEYFSHQRPSFFTSVRMFSSRNNNMEIPYNSEGLMNHHYADGSNFISRTGKEYLDIYPVFDWQKIPGTTIVQKPNLPPESEIQKEGLTDFVGAVTDGLYGAASFDFKSPHDPLKAKKSWFFFDKEYVCLGAGINSGTDLSVVTTLNQCLLHGPVVAMSGNSESDLQHGEWQLDKVKWILHDSVGYIFPIPENVYLSNQPATGSWYKINHQSDSPKEEVTIDVFKLWLDHGKRPDSASYQYIVVPSAGKPEMNITMGSRGVVVLSNTIDIQAVKHLDLGICEAVFYKSGAIQITPSIKIGTDSPGIVMVKTEGEIVRKISVSDPTRKMSGIHLTVTAKIEKTGTDFQSVWNESKKVSEISIDLPKGVYAGKSVTIEF